jgi:hypothetical protein
MKNRKTKLGSGGALMARGIAVLACLAQTPLLAQAPAQEVPANRAVEAGKPASGEKPVLDPGQYFGKAKAGYEAAKAAPEICAKLFCYCGCDLTDEHTSLLDCFTSDHGVDCFICQEEALVANKMKQQGKGLSEVQKTVDLAYCHEYPWDENSPAFKKYIADKAWKTQVEAEIRKARSQGGASSASDKSAASKGTAGNAKSRGGLSKSEAAKRATKGSCCSGKTHTK